ncbi:MAG: effector binding domain-containing protein [Brevefilum sp.]|nr:effector binding domain-containing protein [Brevefilum sp.]
MLKIGEFSKIAQVSVKTLRYYDQFGLLKPAHIDRFTGYRYYSLEQLPRLFRILAFKDLDFSLEQIQGLLRVDLPGETLQVMLADKAAELRQRVTSEQARLYRVEDRLKQLMRSSSDQTFPVVLKSAPDYLIASIRDRLPSINALPEWQEAKLDAIRSCLDSQGQHQRRPDLLIYHQDEFREVDLDVEVGTIICEAGRGAERVLKDEIIRTRILPGAKEIATTIYTDLAGTPSEVYASLARWTQSNGFRTIGPWRELTHHQHDPQVTRMFEIQQPVMHAIEFYTQTEVQEMEPKFITKPGFAVMGLRYFGKNEKGEIADLWGSFNQRVAELGGLPYETGEAAIGLCITPEDAPPDTGFEYVAGFPVSQVEDIPAGFVVRQVPDYTYAVFAHRGDLASLGKTYEYIYEVWLPQSGYQLAAKIDFEYYDQDFKDFAPDSVFYIYVPVQKL